MHIGVHVHMASITYIGQTNRLVSECDDWKDNKDQFCLSLSMGYVPKLFHFCRNTR